MLGHYLGFPYRLNSMGGFSPLDFGSDLKFWALPTDETTVNSLLSADFVKANTEYLSSASTDFDKGNEDFTCGAWVKFNTLTSGTFPMILTKATVTGNQISYQLYYDVSATSFKFRMSDDGTVGSIIDVADTTTASTGIWYFVCSVYDSVNDLQKISVNGSTFTTIANSNGAFASSTADFLLGANNGGAGNFLDGQIDSPFFFDKVLTYAEILEIYSGGSGIDGTYLTDLNGNTQAIGQKFDGSTDAFNIDSVLTPLASTTTGEIELYFKSDIIPAVNERLISFSDTDAQSTISFNVQAGGKISGALVNVGSVVWQFETPASSILVDTWYKINIIQDGSIPVVKINDSTQSLSWIVSVDRSKWFNFLPNLDNARIGTLKWNSAVDSGHLDGAIQNIKIWSDDTQTTQVAEWLMNDVEGANQTDSVGTYDGTPIGTPVSTSASVDNTTISSIESSIVDWWTLNEPSGNRTGLYAHVLTDNNTVGSAVGKLQEEVVNDGDAVYTVIDKSTTNNNAIQTTVTAQPTWTNAKELDFDGSTDFLNLDAIVNDISSDTQGSWFAWVKPTDSTPASFEVILSINDASTVTALDMRVEATTGKFVAYSFDTGVGKWQVTTDSKVFSDNTWCHVGFVQDGVQPILYVDGVAVAQTNNVSSDLTYFINDYTTLDNFRVGCRNINSLTENQHFEGSIGEIVITSTALTSGQVEELYNSQKSVYA